LFLVHEFRAGQMAGQESGWQRSVQRRAGPHDVDELPDDRHSQHADDDGHLLFPLAHHPRPDRSAPGGYRRHLDPERTAATMMAASLRRPSAASTAAN